MGVENGRTGTSAPRNQRTLWPQSVEFAYFQILRSRRCLFLSNTSVFNPLARRWHSSHAAGQPRHSGFGYCFIAYFVGVRVEISDRQGSIVEIRSAISAA